MADFEGINLMVSAAAVARCLDEFESSKDVDLMSLPAWRKMRNEWMHRHGISGHIRADGFRSRSIPQWWTPDTEFWFDSVEQETLFVLKYGK